MSRRGAAKIREYAPDTLYNSKVISKLINMIMWDGKKTVAEQIVYGAMDILKEKTKQDPLSVVLKAIDNVKPEIETRSRRVGGATYQVPVEVSQRRRLTLALRWIIRYSREKSGKSMNEKLAAELLDAFNLRGSSIKKREDTHKMAEANRAFAHYIW
jgi:small subunit ribosomal protein S7